MDRYGNHCGIPLDSTVSTGCVTRDVGTIKSGSTLSIDGNRMRPSLIKSNATLVKSSRNRLRDPIGPWRPSKLAIPAGSCHLIRADAGRDGSSACASLRVAGSCCTCCCIQRLAEGFECHQRPLHNVAQELFESQMNQSDALVEYQYRDRNKRKSKKANGNKCATPRPSGSAEVVRRAAVIAHGFPLFIISL